MAAGVDAAVRLDEGQAAVDTITEYVWACHLLGFSHPDLTGYRHQVRDWYATEDGLDLRKLTAECDVLAATAAVAEEALRLQDSHFQNLSPAWQGAGARASTEFLARHASSASQVVIGIRGAATILTRLRDALWRAVDAKVDAAVQIEARRAGQRGAWLAAARTVSSGLGDRSAASELIDAEVKPFVANDIGGDWLMAMRAATRAVSDAYAEALAALRGQAQPVFAVPAELGPAWDPPRASARIDPAPPSPGGFAGATAGGPPPSAPPVVTAAAAPPATMPAGLPAQPPAPGPEPVTPAAAPEPATAVPASAAGWSGPGLGGGGGMPGVGGLPDVGSGLTGAGRQLADLFGGLIGSSADGLPGGGLGGLSDGELPEDEPDDADADEDDPESDDDGENTTEPGGETADGDPAEDAEVIPPQPVSDPPVAEEAPPESPPTPVPEPLAEPPAEPPAEPLAAPAGETPCEIAADELPQVGG